MNQNEYPWYDERTTFHAEIPPPETYTSIPPYAAPKEIFNYLNKHIHGQTDAKKAASLLVYKAFNNIKQNIFFCGPSGCGKTEIWRQLQQLFPDRIIIADSSSITVDGWSGSTKWKLFRLSANDSITFPEMNVMMLLASAFTTIVRQANEIKSLKNTLEDIEYDLC